VRLEAIGKILYDMILETLRKGVIAKWELDTDNWLISDARLPLAGFARVGAL
jgi:hypothetical protein